MRRPSVSLDLAKARCEDSDPLHLCVDGFDERRGERFATPLTIDGAVNLVEDLQRGIDIAKAMKPDPVDAVIVEDSNGFARALHATLDMVAEAAGLESGSDLPQILQRVSALRSAGMDRTSPETGDPAEVPF